LIRKEETEDGKGAALTGLIKRGAFTLVDVNVGTIEKKSHDLDMIGSTCAIQWRIVAPIDVDVWQ